jgi:hypothetical protein
MILIAFGVSRACFQTFLIQRSKGSCFMCLLMVNGAETSTLAARRRLRLHFQIDECSLNLFMGCPLT